MLEYSDGWIKIQSGNAVGYVPDSALYTGDEAQRRAEEYEKPEATVLAQVLNVRSGQGTDTAILTQVTFGQQYEVTGDAVDNWYPVKAGATDGWVSRRIYRNINRLFLWRNKRRGEQTDRGRNSGGYSLFCRSYR